ncbi:MAG: aminotransferase class V-fold PLP-dependent enzyme [Oscillospiraceae bacterium]|nr:aminotransferase class V-fold PLP-dependent enzyme [Oscillospiraceae bacterium]
MSKYSFKSDYSELAHPQVLAALSAAGSEQFEGYGLDKYSLKAKELIKTKINSPAADIHFVSGGTQANIVVISSVLRSHEAVIACESGHISIHETGAVEAGGHKICSVKNSTDGKLNPTAIDAVLKTHTDEHMVKPRLVYISQSTELGSVYTKTELRAIYEYCQTNGLYLYIDGARLGAGINSTACDLTYEDIAALSDVFYIGGTKNGALFGEAVVIINEHLKADFRYRLKQKGALLAKGAAIGLQFEALFENNLYDELSVRANAMAYKMSEGIRALGYKFLCKTETNQIFPVLPAQTVKKLHEIYGFYEWMRQGELTVVRLAVSWAAPENKIDEFINDLQTLNML